MPQKCSYKNKKNGIQCDREEHANGKCILHLEDKGKNPAIFKGALIKEINNDKSNIINFDGAVFIRECDVFTSIEIKKDISFNEATIFSITFKDVHFLGKVNIDKAIFPEGVNFENCFFDDNFNFNAKVERSVIIFDGCHFEKLFNFSSLYIDRGIQINNCTFKGITKLNKIFIGNSSLIIKKSDFFKNIILSEINIKEGTLEFTDVMIHDVCELKDCSIRHQPTFKNVHFLGKTEIPENPFISLLPKFKDCDLKEMRFNNLFGKFSSIEFINCKWNKKQIGKFKIRYFITDEIENPKSVELLKAYRHLHEYYYNKSEFELSSDFYVGFMITKRRVRERNWLTKAIDIFYSIFSKYGESIVRPLIALILLWFIVPIILLQLGIMLDIKDEKLTKIPIYDSTTKEIIIFTNEYLKTILLNISLSTLFRINDLRPSITSLQHFILLIETILNGLFIAFIALGIRRTFAPKKPISQVSEQT